MILSGQSIAERCRSQHLINPWRARTNFYDGDRTFTFGLGPAGYDVRVDQDVEVYCDGLVVLASTIEHFHMPHDLLGQVCDKSSWARRGLFVQNTIIEPGWDGYLTLELTYSGHDDMWAICKGTPIAQIIFLKLDEPTAYPYTGKYQDQEQGPQEAR